MTEYFDLASAAKAIKYYCQKPGARNQRTIYLPNTETKPGGETEGGLGAVGGAGVKINTWSGPKNHT